MNNSGKTTTYLSLFLVLVVLTGSIYILIPDKVKISVENTNTKFYVWENSKWTLSGTEYVYLYDGSTKMLASSRNVSTNTIGNITTITRTATWKNNISTIDTYTFDSTVKDVELFPISHELTCINCDKKIVQFEYRDIVYDGITKDVTSPISFGHNMKVEWQSGNYYGKVFKQTVSDKLVIKYKVSGNLSTFNVRLFDPTYNQSATQTYGMNIWSGSGSSIYYMNTSGDYEAGGFVLTSNSNISKIKMGITSLTGNVTFNISIQYGNSSGPNGTILGSTGKAYNSSKFTATGISGIQTINLYENAVLNAGQFYWIVASYESGEGDGNKASLYNPARYSSTSRFMGYNIFNGEYINYTTIVKDEGVTSTKTFDMFSHLFAYSSSDTTIIGQMYSGIATTIYGNTSAYQVVKFYTRVNITSFNFSVYNTAYNPYTLHVGLLNATPSSSWQNNIITGSNCSYTNASITTSTVRLTCTFSSPIILDSGTYYLYFVNSERGGTSATQFWINTYYAPESTSTYDGNIQEKYSSSNYFTTSTEQSLYDISFSFTGANVSSIPVINSSRILPSTAYKSDTLKGYCSANDSSDDNLYYYYQWYVNNTVNASGITSSSFASGTEANVNNLSASVQSKGDSWILSCKAYDNYDNSSWMNSTPLIISNTVPSINYVSISPSVLYNITSAIGYCNTTDVDNTNVTYNYIWYKNGVSIKSGTSSSVNSNTLTLVDTLTANYSVGDIITFSCLANDTESVSSRVNSTGVTVIAQPFVIAFNEVTGNRTYEYGTTANITIYPNSTGLCLDIYMLGYGLQYYCTSTNSSLGVQFINYSTIDYFSDLSTLSHLFFRITNTDYFSVSIPRFLSELNSASFSILGIKSSDINGFDDWGYETTSKTYNVVNNTNYVFNITLGDNSVFKSSNFNLQSDNVSFLFVDVCNDGSWDINFSNTFITTTNIDIPSELLNNCSGNVIPIVFNFTYGTGSIVISDFNFELTTSTYPKDITIDVNNDSYTDFTFNGELNGDSGIVNVFNTNSSYVDIVGSTGLNSQLVNLTISNNIDYDAFTFYVTSISNNDVFTEEFGNLTYINTSTTTSSIDNFWNVAKSNTVGSSPVESWVYSKAIPSYKNVSFVYNVISDSGNNVYYFSSDCGTSWTVLNENGLTNIAVPGNCTMWKADMISDGVNYNYIYSVEFSGLGYSGSNLTIDVGDNYMEDGVIDYNASSLSGSTLVTINPDVVNTYLLSCNTVLCTIPINISFRDAVTLRVSNLNLQYNVGEIIVNSNVIKSAITDAKTSRTLVTTFNDSTLTKVFNNTNVFYISVPNNVIVKGVNVTVKGGYS